MINERDPIIENLRTVSMLAPDVARSDRVRERCRARLEMRGAFSWVTIWLRRRAANGSCAVVADPNRGLGRVRVHRQLHHPHGDAVA
jgi:hypothetical protein